MASTLEEPVPGWKGHFGSGGPGGGPPPIDNPAFSTPPGPSTPTGPGGGMPPGPGTPGFSGNFHGPSPGPPHTPGGGPPQLVPCGPLSGPPQGGGYIGSPAGNSGSSTPGPCGPPAVGYWTRKRLRRRAWRQRRGALANAQPPPRCTPRRRLLCERNASCARASTVCTRKQAPAASVSGSDNYSAARRRAH